MVNATRVLLMVIVMAMMAIIIIIIIIIIIDNNNNSNNNNIFGIKYMSQNFNLFLFLTTWGMFWYKIIRSGYRDSYYKDETVVRPSYLYNENPYTV